MRLGAKFNWLIFALTVTSASGADFTVLCSNPKFSVRMIDNGLNSRGVGEGSTGKIQFNITTNSSGPQVVFVNPNNIGRCDVAISEGFRIISGEASIDPTDIYTDYIGAPKSKPAVDLLKQHVSIGWQKNTSTTGTFLVRGPTGGASLMGTVMIYLRVKYEVAD